MSAAVLAWQHPCAPDRHVSLLACLQSPEFFTTHELNLARLADSMKKGGLYVLASFVFGEFNAESVHARQEQVGLLEPCFKT